MTRQLTAAVRLTLLRSPHAKRPPHGRLSSHRLPGSYSESEGRMVFQAGDIKVHLPMKSRYGTSVLVRSAFWT